MKTKIVGNRRPAQTPEELHALGPKLDVEATASDPDRPRGVFTFRTWDDHERWEKNRRIQHARRTPAKKHNK